jgi:hypothetical protein
MGGGCCATGLAGGLWEGGRQPGWLVGSGMARWQPGGPWVLAGVLAVTWWVSGWQPGGPVEQRPGSAVAWWDGGWQSGRLAGGSLAGLRGGSLVGWQAAAWWACGVEVWLAGRRAVTHLFFQCIMTWRSLLWAKNSGCQSFSSPLCFTAAICVTNVSARSLIPGS